MCRFAVECQDKMKELRSKLESKLGPDTVRRLHCHYHENRFIFLTHLAINPG